MVLCARCLRTILVTNRPIFQSFPNYVDITALEKCLINVVRQKSVYSGTNPVLNPIESLQKFVSVPILPPEMISFSPSAEQISKGQQLFVPSPSHKIQFLKSARLKEHLPDHELPEVAFIGRSNVGKSTLIAALLKEAPDAYVKSSSNPGHTKLLNFFQVGKRLCLVDMPGYGFNMPKDYVEVVETYLQSRENLKMTFILIDGKVGVNSNDENALIRLSEMPINSCIVLMKIDKVKPALLLKNVMSVRKYMRSLRQCLPQPFLVSAMTGDGVALLQAFIAHATGNLDASSS
ncbi:GTP-binding protein 8-like isoform X2 [Mya arenaria]|uniref:GTP-binding protein 8-like isoform X2 n=1 Tax=Mya arenaria TaxID=6604 RepID=UPI0022E4FA3B|nr:GTP-binding protein 8-like isoform X2 [Mya arenaria]